MSTSAMGNKIRANVGFVKMIETVRKGELALQVKFLIQKLHIVIKNYVTQHY